MDDTQRYVPLTYKQWVRAQEIASQRHIEDVLGPRPTKAAVAEDMPNPFKVTLLEWAAMLVLVMLTIVTSFKVGAVAVPFSEQMISGLADYVTVSPLVKGLFSFFTGALFIVMATPSLIYFKLLDEDPEIQAGKQATESYAIWRRLSLSYLTPRLPFLIVYGSMFWLFFVSSHGAAFAGRSWWMQIELGLERYLPVILEVGLAHLVGTVLLKRANFQDLLHLEWKKQVAPYDKAVKSQKDSADYLQLLFHTILEQMATTKRNRTLPNIWMTTVPQETVRPIIVAEYKRLHSAGLDFAKEVGQEQQRRTIRVRELEEPKPARIDERTQRRIPPGGDQGWTVESLRHDFLVRGLTPDEDYTETLLQSEYAADYGARSAFRKGAKHYFSKYSRGVPLRENGHS